MQSIDIRTNNFDAGKGRNGGATVDVFTKSGSNQFHGTGDYYFLNNDLVTRTEFQNSVPDFRRQEAGITVGGPVIRDKSFFYGAIDVLRSSNVSAGAYTVETQDFLNWAKANASNTVATQVLQTAPPLNYAASSISTATQVAAASYFPLPANLPADLPVLGTANISFSVPKDGYQYSVRGDYYLGQADRISGEFVRTYDTSVSATPRPNLDFYSLLDFVQDRAASESATPVNLFTHASAHYDRRYRALVTRAFVQDDWRASPRLTLNAGLQFDNMANFFSILSPQLTHFTLAGNTQAPAQSSGTILDWRGEHHQC